MLRGFSRMKLHCFERTFSHYSPALTPIQLPGPMETHLWYVKPMEVNSESLLSQYMEILPPCERENVCRMQGEELRKSALLARALIRTTIARCIAQLMLYWFSVDQINSHTNPRSLKFRKNSHGKPEVEWQIIKNWRPPALHFNLSHTSSLVACGVTVDAQVGIDVEEKHRNIKHNILAFARRYFSKHEVQSLAVISDPRVQKMEFMKLWTLKEAYVKALGKGFSGAPFKTFTIRFEGAAKGGFNTLEDLSPKVSEIIVDCIRNVPGKFIVWKTVPFLEDERVSGTAAVRTISGLQ
ncbi:hypothetical protein OROGR_023937 [Orobanche gracilis]